MPAGIPTSNILQPGVITATSGVVRSIVSDLQLLTPQYWSKYVERYGEEAYDYFFQWLGTFGGMESVKNRNFFWFEARGKNEVAVTNLAQVNTPSAGATVTVNIPASDVYAFSTTGNTSPLAVGMSGYIASSNVEFEIITTPAVDQATIRPKDVTKALVSSGSTNLLAGEILILAGFVDVGEASTAKKTQVHLDQRFDNDITEIRADAQASDLAEMTEVYYSSGVTGDMPSGGGQAGSSYFTYKNLVKTNKRFLNSIERKLWRGDAVTNTGMNSSTTAGTQGFISMLNSNGAASVNYTPGTLDISKLHEITRVMDVNGCSSEAVWLTDIYQRQDFSDGIFKEFPAGAFVYGQGEKSQEASVAYGFQEILIDGYLLKLKKYKPFNTEYTTGKTPSKDYFRNYGIIAPLGVAKGAKDGSDGVSQIKNISVMYQEPNKGGTVGNGIRVWTYGGGSTNPTDGTMQDNLAMITYKGIRVAGANQFVIVSA
jgi:hypothetical protein